LVFLQAFLNNNTIVYLFDSKSSKVGEIISKYKITHISATPSFYRMLLGACRKNLSLIDQVTVGGERLDEILEKDLRKVFPNAKITNIYATTETGSLLKSSGSAFKIPNKYRNQIKISKDNELIIHHSLLGEMFSKNLKDGWYYTKDIVEWINKNEFIIISRKDDIINVGGYMVNPANIEFQLKKISGIVDARVTARKNKITGNILQADIVKKEGESKEKLETVIIKQLEKYLSQWEIPRIIKFVSKMDLTRTYKVSRQ
jgi:acyl-coenzyme A synthetase/AMP-(fatty) acid ligase